MKIMKIIFAQGNPGLKYAHTRHNTGFFLLDIFAKELHEAWTEKKKFNASIIETTINGEKIILAKPSTFYNDTGLSARQLIDFYNIESDNNFLVIHDDLALPLGTIRIRKQGSDAGNNGVKSLNQHISEHYIRIRVGIWNEQRDLMDDIAFVLGTFTKAETETLATLYPTIESYLKSFIDGTLSYETTKL